MMQERCHEPKNVEVPRESEKTKNGFFPEPPEEMNSVNTLTLAQLNSLQTSSAWNHKKKPKLRHF